jgi:hypothetical protein
MITPIDRSQLHLVRGGAANAPRVQTEQAAHTGDRSPLARKASDHLPLLSHISA